MARRGGIVFLTGMSGAGKSTVIGSLQARGYRAFDLDERPWSYYDDEHDWIWAEEVVRELLERESDGLDGWVFVSGCPSNQHRFYSYFEAIVLLSAPEAVLLQRVRERTNNDYGKGPGEEAEISGYLRTVEPLLREVATREVRTDRALDEVVDDILEGLGAPGA